MDQLSAMPDYGEPGGPGWREVETTVPGCSCVGLSLVFSSGSDDADPALHLTYTNSHGFQLKAVSVLPPKLSVAAAVERPRFP